LRSKLAEPRTPNPPDATGRSDRNSADGKIPDGEPVLAIDDRGAGRGEHVIITSDGAGTRALVGSDNTPVRWSVLGIADEIGGRQ
jgi:microcompartment protein CcmK/EutM